VQKATEAPKESPKKRARESEDEDAAPKLSKNQMKKLRKAQQAAAEASGEKNAEAPPQKKQKVEGGKAIPVPAGKKETHPNGGAASSGKKEKEKAKGEKEKEKNGADGKGPTAGKAVKHPNGLITTDTKIGTGATAKKGSRLGMRYIGKLSNEKVFDSNTSGKPVGTDSLTLGCLFSLPFTLQFKFQLGKGDVIKGEGSGSTLCPPD
jgi:FK506-binding nuclear protein